MKTLYTIIVSSFFLATSCSKEELPDAITDENGIIVSMPFIWKTSLHEGTAQSNSSFTVPIQYNNGIAVPTTDGDGKRYMSMINSDDGSLLWKWSDIENVNTDYIDISYIYKNDNLMTYQFGSWSICINLEKGTTHWKIQRDISIYHKIYSNRDNTFFYTFPKINNNGYNEGGTHLCNIQTGDYLIFVTPNYSGEYVNPRNSIGSVNNIARLPNSDNLYAVAYTEPAPNWVNKPYFGLYNSDTKQWVYERISMIETPTFNSSVYWPHIYNNKFYASVGKNLVCHDLDTGEQLWIKQFTQDFSFSGFIIEENKIIASNEDETLYCLNPENGSTIWTVEGSGTSSRLAYLNGIVYFSGGGDGKLHAVDISNGKKVWKLNASNIDKSMFASYNPVYVLPAEGNKPARVFAHTLGNVVCFEAHQ